MTARAGFWWGFGIEQTLWLLKMGPNNSWVQWICWIMFLQLFLKWFVDYFCCFSHSNGLGCIVPFLVLACGSLLSTCMWGRMACLSVGGLTYAWFVFYVFRCCCRLLDLRNEFWKAWSSIHLPQLGLPRATTALAAFIWSRWALKRESQQLACNLHMLSVLLAGGGLWPPGWNDQA